jgi:hypothetical protein
MAPRAAIPVAYTTRPRDSTARSTAIVENLTGPVSSLVVHTCLVLRYRQARDARPEPHTETVDDAAANLWAS